MIQVVALEKGYYKKIRNPGDRFNVPFTAEVIAKSKWLARVGSKLKPKPERRMIPDGRNSPMVDVLKGIAADDYDESDDKIETMSQMTAQISVEENTHARAHGLPTSEPVEEPAQKPIVKRRGRPKGSKNKPKAATTKEVTP